MMQTNSKITLELSYLCSIILIGIGLCSCQPMDKTDAIASSDSDKNISKTSSEWFLATGDWYNDPRLFVKTVGSGPDTVIMLHGGWGGEHRGLVKAVAGLENDFYFVFYDQRGSLRSPFPDSLITLDQHIKDLELLRKELKLSKLNLVGHSMGAFLASAYHHEYPSNVNKLVLLAPAALKSTIPESDTALFKNHRSKLNAFLQRRAIQQELELLNLDKENHLLSSREATNKFRINMGSRFLFNIKNWNKLTGGGPFYNPKVGQLTGNSLPQNGWDYFVDFKKSNVPVSIIIGDHDFLDMEALIIKNWIDKIQHIQLSVIPNAGHVIWIDQPDGFKTTLKTALER